jgi:hypothetical protein
MIDSQIYVHPTKLFSPRAYQTNEVETYIRPTTVTSLMVSRWPWRIYHLSSLMDTRWMACYVACSQTKGGKYRTYLFLQVATYIFRCFLTTDLLVSRRSITTFSITFEPSERVFSINLKT